MPSIFYGLIPSIHDSWLNQEMNWENQIDYLYIFASFHLETRDIMNDDFNC